MDMIIFIDESGDAGFKTSKGSSKSFVIALIIFNDELYAEETALVLNRYRQSIGKTEKYEFKFNKCNQELRLGFLRSVRKCHFRIRAIVMKKDAIYSLNLRNNKDAFYNYCLRQVLEHNNQTIINAKVRLDGRGDKGFKRNLTRYLRQSLNSHTKKVMTNLKFRDSKNDIPIQLADMIAGSLRRHYDQSTNDYDVYRKALKSKEEDIREFR